MNIENIIERNYSSISDKYQKFALEKDQCRACGIYNHYEQVGQSEGNACDPIFMFIGEALGKDEVKEVRPFIGKAGQRLREELSKYPETFNKKSVLISNVLACRPLNNKFPSKEGRKDVETCCNLWVRREIRMLRPQVIVTLGNPALMYIRGDWGITAHRGQWKFIMEYRAWSFATFHPSYVMRCENSGKEYIRDEFESDMKRIVNTWSNIVGGDYRMSLSEEEWEHQLALQESIRLGLIGKS